MSLKPNPRTARKGLCLDLIEQDRNRLLAALKDLMVPIEAGSVTDTDADRNYRDSRQAQGARAALNGR